MTDHLRQPNSDANPHPNEVEIERALKLLQAPADASLGTFSEPLKSQPAEAKHTVLQALAIKFRLLHCRGPLRPLQLLPKELKYYAVLLEPCYGLVEGRQQRAALAQDEANTVCGHTLSK